MEYEFKKDDYNELEILENKLLKLRQTNLSNISTEGYKLHCLKIEKASEEIKKFEESNKLTSNGKYLLLIRPLNDDIKELYSNHDFNKKEIGLNLICIEDQIIEPGLNNYNKKKNIIKFGVKSQMITKNKERIDLKKTGFFREAFFI